MVTEPDYLYVTLLILLNSSHSTSVKFEVLGPTDPIVTVTGDDIILPCYLKPNISVVDMTVDWLNLDFIDERVYRYQNGRIIQEDQIPSYRGRTSLFKEELWRGNTSLKLARVQVTDEGRYKCFIKSQGWYDDVTIQVLVKAVGSRPVVFIEGPGQGGMGLVCQSEGWHPEPDLVWLDSEGVNLSAGPSETHKDFKGFYTVKQHVIVQETDTNLFTCRVLQTRINETMETEVHIPSELFDYTTPWRRSCIVSLSLGVIAVIGLALAVYRTHINKEKQRCVLKKQRSVLAHLWKENETTGDLQYLDDIKTHSFTDFLWTNDDLRKYVFEAIRRHKEDVTLDPDTAHTQLILSDDGKQVKRGDINQDLPDNKKRFKCYHYVLGKEGFSSGRFYYEVQVMKKTGWAVGVVRGSVNRKGYLTFDPEDGYWTVRLSNGVYKVPTASHVTLSLRQMPKKVGVFVDYEEGQVSFFNVEARCHIYTFTGQTFSEKLYPYFCPDLNYDYYDVNNSAPLVICPVDVTY